MSSGLDESQLGDSENRISRKYTNLEKAITDENCIVRLFLSGGGLRVVRVEKNNKQQDLVYYGEHVNFFPAMDNAEQDCINNGKNIREYQAEYYTGNTEVDSNIDLWLRIGGTIFFHSEFGETIAEARYFDGRIILRHQEDSLIDSIKGLDEIMSKYYLPQLSSGLLSISKDSKVSIDEQLILARKPKGVSSNNNDLPF